MDFDADYTSSSGTQSTPGSRPRLISVRECVITDAVGIAVLHHAVMSKVYARAGKVFTPTEEQLVEVWHQKILDTKRTRIAVATLGRRVVGVILVEKTAEDDRGLGKPARNAEIVFFNVYEEYRTQSLIQRLLDYVLPDALPAQMWIERGDRQVKHFLRANGFILDGLTAVDPVGIEYSRMVR